MWRFVIAFFVGVFLVALAGCAASGNAPGMSPEQLKAVAADKNFSAVCSTVAGVWGTGKAVYVNVDKSVVVNGTISVDPNCVVTMTNEATKAAPVAAPKGP